MAQNLCSEGIIMFVGLRVNDEHISWDYMNRKYRKLEEVLIAIERLNDKDDKIISGRQLRDKLGL